MFGQLLKSHFIANYLANEELRRSIQKQLNRVELGQKFSNALFFGKKDNSMWAVKKIFNV